MSKAYSLEEPTPLPTLPELRELLHRHEKVAISHSAADKAYVNMLFEALEEYSVHQFWWNGMLWIEPSISTKAIIEREDQLYAAARQFRQDAGRLMQLMDARFGLSGPNPDQRWDRRKLRKRAGQLNEEWEYQLHGYECRFESTRTGQVLEVIIITRPEFGCLDAYFFHLYLSTTAEFQPLAEWLGERGVTKAINVLTRRGKLTVVCQDGGHRRVAAS